MGKNMNERADGISDRTQWLFEHDWNAAKWCVDLCSNYCRPSAQTAAETVIKNISFNEPVISREEQLPGRTWQSTRGVIVVFCCLLTSVTALGDCHTIAAVIFVCVCVCVCVCRHLLPERDDPWRLCDGQVSAEFHKWQLQLPSKTNLCLRGIDLMDYLAYCFGLEISF